jgi:hypothetical protein
MKTTIEENYKKLLSLGFKRKNIEVKDDPTSGWMEKRIDINEFKGRLYYDGRFALIEIEIYPDVSSKNKLFEVVWIDRIRQVCLQIYKYDLEQCYMPKRM